MMNSNAARVAPKAKLTCHINELLPGAGAVTMLGAEQVAIFYLPDRSPSVYAIGNFDPIGKANVLSRGIVADIDGELVVASPLYKQHFSLRSGQCLEEESVSVPTYGALIADSYVYLLE